MRDMSVKQQKVDSISAIDSAAQLSAGISTTRTLRNIRKSLVMSLYNKYSIDDDDIVDEILKVHGLHDDNFDFVRNIGITINNNISDVSIDSNSNKNSRDVEGITQEIIAPIKKVLGYDYLYRIIKSMYGKEEAYRLMGGVLDYSLGLSDSTNILKPYCWAMDASKLVTMGRPHGQLGSSPSKRIQSYISNLSELIHHMSNHLAGAIAIGTFFLDIAHLVIYEEDITLDELIDNKVIRKKIKNAYQQFVHSINHLSRSNVESPFTNISVFDREKLKILLNEDNYGWYFQKSIGLNGQHESYVIDVIMELQRIFLEFFDKGNPMLDGMPYRFPVVTINITKNKDNDVLDQAFLKYITNLDIYRYNIFTSEGTKVASCCRLISDAEMMDLGSQSNSFGGTSISLGSHRVVTININRVAIEASDEDDFYRILKERVSDAAKVLAAHKKLIQVLKEDGLQPFISSGWIQMNRLFSTFGVLGGYEADLTMKKKVPGSTTDFIGAALTIINDEVKTLSKEHGIIGNIEQIPAEAFAVRLSSVDRLLFGSEVVPQELYTNQYIPLWAEASLWDKMEKDGMYNKLITGGGIVHATIGEKVTAIQAAKIIEFSIHSGCEHFALNAIYSECDNGHMSFGKHIKCNKCPASISNYYTRVVGFFVPVNSWNKTRREWEFPKRTIVTVE